MDVVIVAYNSADYIGACIEALKSQTLQPDSITVVDNSPEDSPFAITNDLPGTEVIRRPENLGFSGGANLGAQRGHSDAILFLNPDVTLSPSWIALAQEILKRTPEVGVLGGKLVYSDGVSIQHAGGTVEYPLATTTHVTSQEAARNEYDPDYVTGAAMVVRRRAFEDLGGFDTSFYPVYYEDVDLCFRAKKRGWRVVYSPVLLGSHIGSASIDRDSFEYYLWTHSQRLKFVLKHHTSEQLLRDFVPAEIQRLRGDIPSIDLEASMAAYRAILGVSYPAIENGGGCRGVNWLAMLEDLQNTWELKEGEFRSKQPILGPILAATRRAINNLSARWYVLQIMEQQKEFNAATFRLLRELVRQVRSWDAPYVMAVALLGHRIRELERQMERMAGRSPWTQQE